LKKELEQDILQDITSECFQSKCARCEESNISDSLTSCPKCGLDFGQPNKYHADIFPPNQLLNPCSPIDFSFIVFQCSVRDRLGCQIFGDGPVAIEKVMNLSFVSTGCLLYGQGKDKQILLDRGLLPTIADVVISVNGIGVAHLNVTQVIMLV
jgi:hypothetical protein